MDLQNIPENYLWLLGGVVLFWIATLFIKDVRRHLKKFVSGSTKVVGVVLVVVGAFALITYVMGW